MILQKIKNDKKIDECEMNVKNIITLSIQGHAD